MKWLLVVMYLAKMADLGTTEMFLAQGGWEENPLMENRAVRWTAGAITPLVIYKLFGVGGNRKVQAVACVAMTTFWSYLAVKNYRLAGRLEAGRQADMITEIPRGFRVQFAVSW